MLLLDRARAGGAGRVRPAGLVDDVVPARVRAAAFPADRETIAQVIVHFVEHSGGIRVVRRSAGNSNERDLHASTGTTRRPASFVRVWQYAPGITL
jgi:hypothetical protein